MVEYENTKIYFVLVNGKKYYGHTAQKYLSIRQRLLRSAYRNFKFTPNTKCKLMLALKENNMTPEDIVCVLVENYPCKNVDEAKAREQYWILKGGELNTYVPHRTRQESNKASNEKRRPQRAETHKKWWEANKDRVNTTKKENYDNVKDNINSKRREQYHTSEDSKKKALEASKAWRKENKDKCVKYKKEYYKKNAEMVKAKRKAYYETNKDIINEKRRQQRVKNNI